MTTLDLRSTSFTSRNRESPRFRIRRANCKPARRRNNPARFFYMCGRYYRRSDSTTSVAPPLVFNLRFYALFAVCLFLIFPLHESAHYLTYRAMGVRLQMTLNTASPADQSQRKAIAEFAGPIFNLLLAIACLLAFYIARQRQLVWAAMGLAASMMRLVVYGIIIVAATVTGSGMTMGNDDPIAASLWGLPSLTFVIALAPL